jgi:heme a synthase
MTGHSNSYKKYTWFIFFMVFLVILAGGVVRMTQSGMGCPDWPRCFGRWIPPSSAEQLPADFEKYLGKQDIDHSFNPYHTWIEYINRLLGALLGVFIIIHFVWTYRIFRKTNKQLVIYSLILLLAVAFQGWLGKRVVDENLEAVKVTTHMLAALFIAALPLFIIYKLKDEQRVRDRLLKILSMCSMVIVIIQIILGTQVREQIDVISRSYKYESRQNWIAELNNLFIVHRSFTWIVALVCIYLCWKAYKYPNFRLISIIIVLLLFMTIAAGLSMLWFNIPAIAQPLHLLLASSLLISLLILRLKCI